MSKKFLKNPQITTSRQLIDPNLNKITDIKQLSSPYKKIPISNSKITFNSKNPILNSNIKKTQNDSEAPQQQLVTKTQNKIKQDCPATIIPPQKMTKKAVSTVRSSQNLKKFSKTSKIPTLRLTTEKGTSDESESEIAKNIESNVFVEESFSQSGSIKNFAEQSSVVTSMLKSQFDVLKSQNQELKKQNQKLAKKLQKLRSLNDENKKLLKERIENFNLQGQNLRKLRDEIKQLENCIEKLKEKVIELERENILLKSNAEKINTLKISREIQATIVQTVLRNKQGDKQVKIDQPLNPEIQKLPQLSNQNNTQQKYETSSSRKSYGGILPLQTVVKLNASRFRIDFRLNENTPKKSPINQQKLMEKYENYWSQKFQKQPRKNKNLQDQNDQTFGAKSQYMTQLKNLTQSDDKNRRDDVMNLEMYTVNQNKNHQQEQQVNQQSNFQHLDENKQEKIQPNQKKKDFRDKKPKKQNYRKQIQQKIQNLKYFSGQTHYLQQIQDQKKAFSPSILIQNYRKISQQEELIKSLYRVIQQLYNQIQTIQKRQDHLIKLNKELSIKFQTINLQKHIIQKNNAEEFTTHFPSNQQVLQQLKNDTLLLDQTKQDKNQSKEKFQIPKLTSAERINQILIFQNNEPLPLNQKLSPYKQLYKVQSAHEQYVKQTKIIDEISRFCHSQVLSHESFDLFIKSDTKENESFEKMENMQKKQSDNKSSTKQEEAFKIMDELDRQIYAGTLEQSQFKAIVKQQGLNYRQQQNHETELRASWSSQSGSKNAQIQQKNLKEYEQGIQREKIHFELKGKQLQQCGADLRMEDSLDALEYFSDHTPRDIDISQNVSGFNHTFYQLNTTQLSQQNAQTGIDEPLALRILEDQNQIKERVQNDNIELTNLLRQSLIRVEESRISNISNI